MKAKILPLDSDYKYFGTKIEIDFQDGYSKEIISLFGTGEIMPSERERPSGMTEEEWERQWEIDVQENNYYPPDHFEDKVVYERAIKLIEIINNHEK